MKVISDDKSPNEQEEPKESLLYGMWKKFRSNREDAAHEEVAKPHGFNNSAPVPKKPAANKTQLVEGVPYQWRDVIDITRSWNRQDRELRGIHFQEQENDAVVEDAGGESYSSPPMDFGDLSDLNILANAIDLQYSAEGGETDENAHADASAEAPLFEAAPTPTESPLFEATPAETPLFEPEEKKTVSLSSLLTATDEETPLAEAPSVPVAAKVKFIADNLRMMAAITVIPPNDGGPDVTLEQIIRVLDENKVVHGIFDHRLQEIIEFKLYNREYIVAMGSPPFDGADGRIVDYFPRDREIKFAARLDGSIDFKTRNTINNIIADTLICEAIPSVNPISGMNILGQELKGKLTKTPPLPKGDNTKVVEGKLYSDSEGDIVFRDGKFKVQKVFEVPGDVDNSVGNIDFAGDVMVKGDVREGFIIKAKGSVVIMGMVEGASIIAEGGITIQNGMNGMNKGIIRTQKGLTSKYLENCIIYAHGDVVAESIIYSSVACDGEVKAAGKHGAIIGGSFTVYKGITAKTVGALSNAPTLITLGVTPELMTERAELKKEQKALQEQRRTIEMDIQYLSVLLKKNNGQLPPDKAAHVQRLKIQEPINRKRIEAVAIKLEEAEEKFSQVDKSFLSCTSIYPGVQITIGNAICNVTAPAVNCRYSLIDGEITLRSKA